MPRRLIPITLLITLLPPPAAAADPQPYTVTLNPTGEPAMDAALKDSSSLLSLRENAPVGPFALITRAREDRTRLQTALGSFGYYDGKIAVTIAGRDLDDPALPTALETAPATVEVALAITQGQQYRLRRIDLQGASDPASRAQAQAALQLEPGAPARAAEILAAQSRILEALRSSGHALARVDTPAATLDPAAHTLDVAYRIDPGPAVNLGPIAIQGLDRMDESFVRRRLLIKQGEQFDPAKIETARQDLASLGVFATVRARAASTLDPQGQIPITVDLAERPRHVVAFNAGFSTDLGGSAGVTWQHRNLFGAAEQLNLGAAVTGLGGSAVTRPGYNVTAALTKPDVFTRDQSVTISLQAIKESLEAYDRKAVLGGVQFTRKLDERWTATAGLLAQQSRIAQEGATNDYSLIGLPLGVKYDSTGTLFEPISGIKAALTVTPTASLRGGTNFAILQATASTYLNLAQPGRSVIALRGTIASIQGATTFQVPPDQRLYAGGSATIRGYKYQSVGPTFISGHPTGGTSLAAATVEFRQRFGESLGAVIFVDAGQVDNSSSPFSGNIRTGAGIGARYYTAIGPIRLDIAVPRIKQRNNDSFEIYIGLGQAF